MSSFSFFSFQLCTGVIKVSQGLSNKLLNKELLVPLFVLSIPLLPAAVDGALSLPGFPGVSAGSGPVPPVHQ